MPTKQKEGHKQFPPIQNTPIPLSDAMSRKYLQGKAAGYWRDKVAWLRHVDDNLPMIPKSVCTHKNSRPMYDDEYSYTYCKDCTMMKKV